MSVVIFVIKLVRLTIIIVMIGMLRSPATHLLLKLLLQRRALLFHGRDFDRLYLSLQCIERGSIGRICCRVGKRLLIAGVLLLIICDSTTALLHQRDPLLIRLELCIPFAL